jgi:serine/threonine-protein kinase
MSSDQDRFAATQAEPTVPAVEDEPAATQFDPYATAAAAPEALPDAVFERTEYATQDSAPELDATAAFTPDASPFDAPAVTTGPTRDDPFATRAELPTEGVTGAWGGPSSDEMPTYLAPGASRYRPVKLHAKGGLGEVYVAIDGELNREVALKEIQERHLDRVESQVRFVFEAEVTGGLEHPGIVPVYGLGRYPDGRPYYAMRFIRGVSLREAIKSFHADDPTSKRNLAHSLPFRLLLNRFASVCQAIEYAHNRGVIHRDIKPENVMLGPHGETLVVDWGLAKSVDRAEPADAAGPGPLRPLSGAEGSNTQMGSVLGTPAFMSPEQAAGEIENLGPASDIFSLGSTLYALLTGHGPFREKTITELLEAVRFAKFPAPRSINPNIPKPLEAICQKAMAVRPSDRYLSAAGLAADIERWLNDEPVSAYQEPALVRLGRWTRRHRTAVASTFALLTTATLALVIANVFVTRERDRAERNFVRARSAVEQMLTKVGEVDLADVPQMESVRRDLLDRALGFYREFLEEKGGDSPSTLETGRALVRLGDIRELLGLYQRAEADYRGALALLDKPAARPGADPELAKAVARAEVGLGILLKKSNRFLESESSLRQAIIDLERLSKTLPDDVDVKKAQARARYQLGTLLARLKDRSDQDEALYRAAIAEQEAIVQAAPDRPEGRRDLARFLNNLGMLQSGADRPAAEATFRRALKIQDELEPTSAGNAGFRWQRSRTRNNLAILLASSAPADSEALFLQAKAGLEALAADFPKVPDYPRELAITLNNLALLLERKPNPPFQPLGLLQSARETQQALTTDFPEMPDHRQKLAVTDMHLGDLLASQTPAEADSRYEEATGLLARLVGDAPEVPEYQTAYGRALDGQASLKLARREWAAAEELLEPAIGALAKARSGNPREKSYDRLMIEARDHMAQALAGQGRHADLAIEAGLLAAVVPDKAPGHLQAAAWLTRSLTLVSSDAALAEPGRKELEETYAKAAVVELRKAMDAGASDPAVLDGPNYRPLKGRADFEALREAWKAKGKRANV